MLRCRGRRCFFQSGSGSEELLAALGRSQQLEASERRGPHSFLLPSRSGRQEVDFTDCDEIPDAAWELLGDGAWPRLRVAEGVPEEHLQRLRDEASLDLEAAAGGWKREKRAFGALVSSLALALGSATSVETSGAHGATALSLSHAQLQEVRHTGTLGMQGMHGRMDGWMDGRMDWMSVWGPEAVATARGRSEAFRTVRASCEALSLSADHLNTAPFRSTQARWQAPWSCRSPVPSSCRCTRLSSPPW